MSRGHLGDTSTYFPHGESHHDVAGETERGEPLFLSRYIRVDGGTRITGEQRPSANQHVLMCSKPLTE